MPYVRTSGGPAFSPDFVRAMSLGTRAVPRIPYVADGHETIELDRFAPKSRLSLRLNATMTVATADLASRHGWPKYHAWRLIRWLSVYADGQKLIMRVPGEALGLLTELYSPSGAKPRRDDVGTGQAAHSVRMHAILPFDVGGYLSLLDATRFTRVTVEVQWANPAAIGTPGQTGTFAVTDAQLDITEYVVQGGPPNEMGGPGFGYPVHHITTRELPITTTQSDFRVRLEPNRQYSSVILMARTSAGPKAGAVTNATFRMGTNSLRDLPAGEIEEAQFRRYQPAAASDYDGLWVVDVGDPSHFEHGIVASDRIPLDLLLSVNASDSPTLYVIEDYLTAPGT